jgi:EAL domain-containing protein (putative c-di-GMP-specific phosphodiesterase class I)
LQRRQLTALGATLFQGYLYGRPMALAEIDRWFLSCAFAAAPSEVPETPVTP